MAVFYITSDRIQSKMSPVGRDLLEGLSRIASVQRYGPGLPGFRGDRLPEVIAQGPRRVGLVIADESTLLESLSGFRMSSLAGVAIPKAHFVVDFWSDVAQRRAFCQRNRVDVLITRYEAGLPVLRSFGVPHIVHCPHTVDPTQIPAALAERPCDIMISGAMMEDVYPLRVRLFRLLSRCADFRTLYIPHPGYRDLASLPPDAPVGKRYYAAIASARVAIATSSTRKLPFRKYIEIAACGTIVAGDLPTHGIEPIRDHMVRLDLHMSDEEIAAALRRGLSQFEASAVERAQLTREVISEYGNTAVARQLLRDIAHRLGMPSDSFLEDEEAKAAPTGAGDDNAGLDHHE
jgi:hypothetical protein